MTILYATLAVSAVLVALAAVMAVRAGLESRRDEVAAENAEKAARAAEYAAYGVLPEDSAGRPTGFVGRRLIEAGLSVSPGRWGAETAVMAIGGACIVTAVTGNPGAGVLVAVVVAAARALHVEMARSRRTTRFEQQLSDALPMVAENLRSGNGPAQSLTAVAAYMPDPLKGEFSRAAADMRLGIPFTQAMDDMYARVPCNDLRLLNGVIAVNAEAGGDLSGTLDGIADTMQRRAQMRGHIRSITASGRLSAGVIVSLPWIILLAMWLISPAYIDPLVRAGWLGVAIVAGVALMDAVGFLIIRRICAIRFD